MCSIIRQEEAWQPGKVDTGMYYSTNMGLDLLYNTVDSEQCIIRLKIGSKNTQKNNGMVH